MGLSLNFPGWMLAIVLSLGWILSIALVPRLRRDGARALVMSLFGFIWLGFGLSVVLRFWVLSYDSFHFGNFTSRLADIPADSVSAALLAALIYWAGICASYIATKFIPSAGGLFSHLLPLTRVSSRSAVVLLWAGTTIFCVLTSLPGVLPAALLTPIGALSRLWVVPAALVWGCAWGKSSARNGLLAGASRSQVHQARALSLFPPILVAALTPYRETLVVAVMVPLVSRLYAGARVSAMRLVTIAAVALIGSSLSIAVLRMVRWNGMSLSEAVANATAESDTFSGTPQALEDVTRRFHAFDSLLLTIDRVPRVFQHSNRGLFMEAALTGFAPRLFLPWKESRDRGQRFAVTIWSETVVERENPAAIAPSMAGDAYDAQGWTGLASVAVAWGFLIGCADRWRGASPPVVAAAIVALFGIQSAASIERDFVTTTATFLQTNVAMALGIWLVRVLSASTPGRLGRSAQPSQAAGAPQVRVKRLRADSGGSELSEVACHEAAASLSEGRSRA